MSGIATDAAAETAAVAVRPLLVGSAAKALREALGLTVEQLAALIGEAAPNIRRFEANQWAATQDLLDRYLAAFKVDLHMYCVAFQAELAGFPAKIRPVVQQLKDLWAEEIAAAAAAFSNVIDPGPSPAPQQAVPNAGATKSSGSSSSSAVPDPGATSDSPHSDVPGAGSK